MNPIVGIGELLWDVYPDGRKVAGGAPFNFAFHCRQLGHPAVIVSRVGDDDLGRELREEVRRLGLSDEYIQTDRDHPTGTVRVALDANKVPRYTIAQDVAWDYIGCPDTLYPFAASVPAVCYGTLGQRTTIGRAAIADFTSHVRLGLRVFDVNLRGSPIDRGWLQGTIFDSNWVKVNDDELTMLADLFAMRSMQLVQMFFDIGLTRSGLWLVTRGADGVEIFRPLTAGSTIREPGVPSEIVDTVGAGDAFTAATVCLHLEGRPLHECARFANHYAGRVCEHQGATPRIDRAEVERAAFGK
jgi:fructokinase